MTKEVRTEKRGALRKNVKKIIALNLAILLLIAVAPATASAKITGLWSPYSFVGYEFAGDWSGHYWRQFDVVEAGNYTFRLAPLDGDITVAQALEIRNVETNTLVSPISVVPVSDQLGLFDITFALVPGFHTIGVTPLPGSNAAMAGADLALALWAPTSPDSTPIVNRVTVNTVGVGNVVSDLWRFPFYDQGDTVWLHLLFPSDSIPAGYDFTGWQVVSGGVTLNQAEWEGLYYFIMGSQPVVINAVFTRNPAASTFSVNVNNPLWGTAEVTGWIYDGMRYVFVSVTPNPGYTLSHWEWPDGTPVMGWEGVWTGIFELCTDPPTDTQLTAVFRPMINPREVTSTANNASLGLVSSHFGTPVAPNVSQFEPDSAVNISASPMPWANFINWTVVSGDITINYYGYWCHFVMPNNNVEIMANFAVNNVPPTILHIWPDDGMQNLELTQNLIGVTFDKPMNIYIGTATLTGTSGTYLDLAGASWCDFAMSASIPIVGNTLDYDTLHTITLSGFEDIGGNAMVGTHTVTFRTIPEPPPPFVMFTTPADNAVNISANLNEIVVRFDVPMNPASGTFSLIGASTAKLGTPVWSLNNRIATIPVTSQLDFETVYTITVSSFEGLTGTMVTHTSNFTTAAGAANIAPSITQQPANRSVHTGQTATFTVAATGTPAPTIQWQVNDGSGWANIAGATGTTLTLTSVTLAMSGNQYRAVATNSVGSATSNAATLTVTTPPVIGNGGGGGVGGAPSVATTGVTIAGVNTRNMTVNETLTLTANVQPANATNSNVRWTSSNPSVATVNANGVVTAVAEGTATITVTTIAGNHTAQITIIVTDEEEFTPTPPPLCDSISDWAIEQVKEAIEAGLVPELLQSDFTQTMTRAEFTALTVALYEAVTGREITGRKTFIDTDDVNVQKAAYIGVTIGVGGNRFAPNAELTREQAAVMLARLAYILEQPLPEQSPTFADNAYISFWAFDDVGRAQAGGIMEGVGNNIFAPQSPYTREQSIATILRLFEFLEQ